MWKLEIFMLLGPLIFFPTSDCGRSPQEADCPANATDAHCSKYCPETCEFDGVGVCPPICGGPCECKPGYIIDQRIPVCVLRSDCPKDVIQKPGTTSVKNFKCLGANRCHIRRRRSN